MILSELHEITSIDSEIVQLHERLEALYVERASICAKVTHAPSSSAKTSVEQINLDEIDLSL